jgi:hypothetical protein
VYNSQFLLFNILYNGFKANEGLIKYHSEDAKPKNFRVNGMVEGESQKDDTPTNFKAGV